MEARRHARSVSFRRCVRYPRAVSIDDAIAAGFDLVHPFDAGLVPWLEARGRALLVGNTRALWEPFSHALARPELADEDDPLDRYTERVLEAAWPRARIVYAHRAYAGAYLPFQRLAVDVGLAARSPTQLLLHPAYGPWFALRAVILVGGSPPPRGAPVTAPCTCTGACEAAFANALERADDPAAWIAVRDACSSRHARYCEAQIEFHYRSVWESRRRTPRP